MSSSSELTSGSSQTDGVSLFPGVPVQRIWATFEQSTCGWESLHSGVWLMAPTLEARADVEVSLSGDSLVSLAFPWAGNGLPFSQVVEIQRNSIDPTVVGRMVFDRHGLDSNPVLGLVQAPFASPYPGRMVLISQWGSNNAGCYMEMVLQLGVAGAMQNSQMLIPTEVMLNVGGQVVTLQAQRSEAQFANAQSFQYSEYDSSTSSNVNKTGVWYTGRHLFRISASDAAILSNASAQNVPIRVVLNDRLPITYELGSGTVQRWRSVFNYNPSCGNSGVLWPAAVSVLLHRLRPHRAIF